jgi:hypothetical protein
MRALISSHWMGILFYLATLAGVSGQIATSSPSSSQQASPAPVTSPVSQNQATLQAYQQEQQALAQSLNALLAQNPTQQQLQAWHQQNAAQLQAQQQQAMAMAAASALQPMPVNVQPNIPPNASQALKDLLTTQAALANGRAQIHNQLVQAMSPTASNAQVSQMQQSEEQLFEQQQATNLQAQAQQAQTLADESAQQPVPLPPPLVIPAGTTQPMAAFLTARDQLMRAQITFSNQYVTATPAVRAAAMQQWMQQNAGQFQQVQALAQNLSPTSSTTSPTQN